MNNLYPPAHPLRYRYQQAKPIPLFGVLAYGYSFIQGACFAPFIENVSAEVAICTQPNLSILYTAGAKTLFAASRLTSVGVLRQTTSRMLPTTDACPQVVALRIGKSINLTQRLSLHACPTLCALILLLPLPLPLPNSPLLTLTGLLALASIGFRLLTN